MNTQPAKQKLYALEAEISRIKATKKLAKEAIDNVHDCCQQIAEWLRTAEKRENE